MIALSPAPVSRFNGRYRKRCKLVANGRRLRACGAVRGAPGGFVSASGAPTFVTPFRYAFHLEISDPTGRGRGYPLIPIARGLKCVCRRVPMCGKFLKDHLVTAR
jgi:hypothetical protein